MTGPIACLLVSVVCAAAQGQDRDLAAELVERGWVDLAEDLCRKPGSTIAADPYTLALIAAARAREESSVDRAALELDRAIERFGKADRSLFNLERVLLGRLHVQKATLLSKTAEGAQAWQEAESFYRAAIAMTAQRPNAPDVDELLLDLRLELPRVLAARAKATVAEAARKALLDEAAMLLLEYQLDTGNLPVYYEALLEEGRVRVEMKDYAKGLRCFRGVLDLKKKGAALKGYPAALWDAAFANIVRAMTLSGKAKDAATLCEQFLNENPTRARTPMGISVLLSQAEALHAAGDGGGAIDRAQRVAGMDPDGLFGRTARDRICEWMKDGSGTPDIMLLVADGLIEQRRYRDALVDLRRCVEICSGDVERSRFEPVTAFKRGECFRALKQEAEAAIAFQDVFRRYPKHDLARRAAFEAVRSLSHVTSSTRDPRDQDRQEQLLKEVERLGLQGSNVAVFRYLEAEVLERNGQWKAAADLYRQVDPNSEVYEEALVSAAHGYRRDAETRGAKSGEEAAGELKVAEELLRLALGRMERTPESKLLPSAEFELASVCLSDAVRKPREALTVLDRCSKRLSPDHDQQARLGEMALRAHLALEELPAAVNRLEKLLQSFPDSPSTARAARRIALAQEASDPESALKAYRIWLDRTEAAGSPASDLQSVSESLGRLARTLSHFDDRIASVVDLRGNSVPHRAAWKEAARAQWRLLGLTELTAKVRPGLQARVACSVGLAAESIEEWARLKKHCEGLITSAKLALPNGDLDVEVLRAQRWLAGIYLEYGHALYQLGRLGQKYQYGSALKVFNNLSTVTEAGSEPWWISKWLGFRILWERGEGDDLRFAAAGLSLLEGNRPELDEGKYGIRELLRTLRDQIREARGLQR